VLDAVMEGIESFGEPRVGDAIVIVAAGHGREPQSQLQKRGGSPGEASHTHVRSGAWPGERKKQCRQWDRHVYGIARLAQVTPGVGSIVYETGDDNFFPLTTNSGGLVLVVLNGAGGRAYNSEDARARQEVNQKATAVFNMIFPSIACRLSPLNLLILKFDAQHQ